MVIIPTVAPKVGQTISKLEQQEKEIIQRAVPEGKVIKPLPQMAAEPRDLYEQMEQQYQVEQEAKREKLRAREESEALQKFEEALKARPVTKDYEQRLEGVTQWIEQYKPTLQQPVLQERVQKLIESEKKRLKRISRKEYEQALKEMPKAPPTLRTVQEAVPTPEPLLETTAALNEWVAKHKNVLQRPEHYQKAVTQIESTRAKLSSKLQQTYDPLIEDLKKRKGVEIQDVNGTKIYRFEQKVNPDLNTKYYSREIHVREGNIVKDIRRTPSKEAFSPTADKRFLYDVNISEFANNEIVATDTQKSFLNTQLPNYQQYLDDPNWKKEYHPTGKLKRLYKEQEYVTAFEADPKGSRETKDTYIPQEFIFDTKGYLDKSIKRKTYDKTSKRDEGKEYVDTDVFVMEEKLFDDYGFMKSRKQRDVTTRVTDKGEISKPYLEDLERYQYGESVLFKATEFRQGKKFKTETLDKLQGVSKTDYFNKELFGDIQPKAKEKKIIGYSSGNPVYGFGDVKVDPIKSDFIPIEDFKDVIETKPEEVEEQLYSGVIGRTAFGPIRALNARINKTTASEEALITYGFKPEYIKPEPEPEEPYDQGDYLRSLSDEEFLKMAEPLLAKGYNPETVFGAIVETPKGGNIFATAKRIEPERRRAVPQYTDLKEYLRQQMVISGEASETMAKAGFEREMKRKEILKKPLSSPDLLLLPDKPKVFPASSKVTYRQKLDLLTEEGYLPDQSLTDPYRKNYFNKEQKSKINELYRVAILSEKEKDWRYGYEYAGQEIQKDIDSFNKKTSDYSRMAEAYYKLKDPTPEQEKKFREQLDIKYQSLVKASKDIDKKLVVYKKIEEIYMEDVDLITELTKPDLVKQERLEELKKAEEYYVTNLQLLGRLTKTEATEKRKRFEEYTTKLKEIREEKLKIQFPFGEPLQEGLTDFPLYMPFQKFDPRKKPKLTETEKATVKGMEKELGVKREDVILSGIGGLKEVTKDKPSYMKLFYAPGKATQTFIAPVYETVSTGLITIGKKLKKDVDIDYVSARSDIGRSIAYGKSQVGDILIKASDLVSGGAELLKSKPAVASRDVWIGTATTIAFGGLRTVGRALETVAKLTRPTLLHHLVGQTAGRAYAIGYLGGKALPVLAGGAYIGGVVSQAQALPTPKARRKFYGERFLGEGTAFAIGGLIGKGATAYVGKAVTASQKTEYLEKLDPTKAKIIKQQLRFEIKTKEVVDPLTGKTKTQVVSRTLHQGGKGLEMQQKNLAKMSLDELKALGKLPSRDIARAYWNVKGRADVWSYDKKGLMEGKIGELELKKLKEGQNTYFAGERATVLKSDVKVDKGVVKSFVQIFKTKSGKKYKVSYSKGTTKLQRQDTLDWYGKQRRVWKTLSIKEEPKPAAIIQPLVIKKYPTKGFDFLKSVKHPKTGIPRKGLITAKELKLLGKKVAEQRKIENLADKIYKEFGGKIEKPKKDLKQDFLSLLKQPLKQIKVKKDVIVEGLIVARKAKRPKGVKPKPLYEQKPVDKPLTTVIENVMGSKKEYPYKQVPSPLLGRDLLKPYVYDVKGVKSGYIYVTPKVKDVSGFTKGIQAKLLLKTKDVARTVYTFSTEYKQQIGYVPKKYTVKYVEPSPTAIFQIKPVKGKPYSFEGIYKYFEPQIGKKPGISLRGLYTTKKGIEKMEFIKVPGGDIQKITWAQRKGDLLFQKQVIRQKPDVTRQIIQEAEAYLYLKIRDYDISKTFKRVGKVEKVEKLELGFMPKFKKARVQIAETIQVFKKPSTPKTPKKPTWQELLEKTKYVEKLPDYMPSKKIEPFKQFVFDFKDVFITKTIPKVKYAPSPLLNTILTAGSATTLLDRTKEVEQLKPTITVVPPKARLQPLTELTQLTRDLTQVVRTPTVIQEKEKERFKFVPVIRFEQRIEQRQKQIQLQQQRQRQRQLQRQLQQQRQVQQLMTVTTPTTDVGFKFNVPSLDLRIPRPKIPKKPDEILIPIPKKKKKKKVPKEILDPLYGYGLKKFKVLELKFGKRESLLGAL